MRSGTSHYPEVKLLRVLTLTNMYPPDAYGGYELSCADVMRRWRERGHEVFVLTSAIRVPGVLGNRIEPTVFREVELYWHDHVLLEPPLHRCLAIEQANQAALRRALSVAQPDVISVWNMGAMSLGLLTSTERAGYPHVLVVGDDWLCWAPKMDPWISGLHGRSILARIVHRIGRVPTYLPALAPDRTLVAFNSARTRDFDVSNGYWKFPQGVVLPPGVDFSDFPSRPRALASWSGRIICAGRIDPRKGIGTLIQAIAQLPDTALDVIGDGDPAYRRELADLVVSLGLQARVRFDAVSRAELSDLYRAADVCVFPSEWEEPFGLVPLEAMACGTPVIATGVGGSSEFLRNEENCLLFSPGDASHLAKAIARLGADESLRTRLAEAGLITASSFTADHYADELERMHLSAVELGSPRKRAPRRHRQRGNAR